MLPVADPGEDGSARASDLAVGLVRSLWPWLVFGGGVVLFLAFLLWGANRPDDPQVGAGGGGGRTVTTPADGLQFSEVARRIGEECLDLLVADTAAERASGLRGREGELDRVDGMIFQKGPTVGIYFTMAGVTEALDVGFYDEDGRSLGVTRMNPCSSTPAECPKYRPPVGFVDAVETAPGVLPEGDLGGRCRSGRS